MNVGYNHPLYILPFDHRAAFKTGLFGLRGNISDEQTGRLSEAKRVVYDGFRLAVERGTVARDCAGIVLDEKLGGEILRDAAKAGFVTSAPTEKSGQDEFQFEFGEDFASHIES